MSFQKLLPQATTNDESEEVDGEETTAVISKPDTELKEPSMYRVYLHNDDYTPMEFVVAILERIFHFDQAKANQLMLDVHHKGIACCGTYPYEIAETKVMQVTNFSKQNQYPLKCILKKSI